jgi:hypothetical protein
MSMTMEELIDSVNQELTVGCMLPKILPDIEIRRIISQRALPWFIKNYRYAVIKSYYLVTKDAMQLDPTTGHRSIILPCDIVNVTWIYKTNHTSLLQLGLNAPNLSINFGVTNQPYLSSYLTTVGELGVYKVVMDGFADMLNQLSKVTYKYHYNQNDHRLHILTSVDENNMSNPNMALVLEVYVAIEEEAIFSDELFQRYVVGMSKQQLGNLLGRYNFNLPGGIQINVADIQAQAEKEVTEAKEEVNKMTNTSFFKMRR